MRPSDKTNAVKFRGWVLRAVVSGIVLSLVFSFLPISDVLATAQPVDANLWLASLVIFWVGHVISAAKWQQLLVASRRTWGVAKRQHETKNRTLSLSAGSSCNLRLPNMPNNCPWPWGLDEPIEAGGAVRRERRACRRGQLIYVAAYRWPLFCAHLKTHANGPGSRISVEPRPAAWTEFRGGRVS